MFCESHSYNARNLNAFISAMAFNARSCRLSSESRYNESHGLGSENVTLGAFRSSIRPDTSNLMAVEYGGVAVNVPVPEAYAIQKLVIHGDRVAQQSGKDIKDAEAVIELWPLLDMERLLNVKLQLTKKETRRFEEALSRFGLSLDGSVRDCNAELEHVSDIYRAALSGGRDGRTPVIDAATLRDENDC